MNLGGIGGVAESVAVVLTLGGPGAVFWMWMVAAIVMATAFVEATLPQPYKTRMPDSSFRGAGLEARSRVDGPGARHPDQPDRLP